MDPMGNESAGCFRFDGSAPSILAPALDLTSLIPRDVSSETNVSLSDPMEI